MRIVLWQQWSAPTQATSSDEDNEEGEDDDAAVAAAERSRAVGVGLAVAAIAVTQVVATQLTRLVQTSYGVTAPFCVTWTHAAAMAVCFPLGRSMSKGAAAAARASSSSSSSSSSPSANKEASFGAVDVAAFFVLFVAANYSYVAALRYAPPSVVQTVFGTAPASRRRAHPSALLRERKREARPNETLIRRRATPLCLSVCLSLSLRGVARAGAGPRTRCACALCRLTQQSRFRPS